MTEVSTEDWSSFKMAIEINERPSQIGSLFFKVIDGAGYTAEEIRAIAKTLLAYAA